MTSFWVGMLIGVGIGVFSSTVALAVYLGGGTWHR